MNLTTKQKFELKKFVKDISTYRGRHTELVTVYVPSGYDLNKVLNQLNQEKGTATNIKSTSTRKNVVDALERMTQHLKLYPQTPPNGLAAFSGNVAEREGQSDVKVWSLEPPIPLKIRIYRCDKQFVVEPLDMMLEHKEVYGLIVLDRRDANIAYLKGKAIIPLVKTHSHVPGKIRAGGQSAQRYARLTEGAKKEHFKKVAEYVKEQFLGHKELKGIIVGGPGPTKYSFVEGDFITQNVKDKIIAIKDLSYTGDFGLQELVDKSQDVLAKEDIAAEKLVMSEFFKLLSTVPGKVSYGEAEVMEHLQSGAVDKLLLSEDLDEDKIDQFELEAEKQSSDVRIISVDTREGVQLKDIGKIAAILRYEV